MNIWFKKQCYRYGLWAVSIVSFVLVAGALYSFSATDESWFFHSTKEQAMHNFFGYYGACLAATLIWLCGYMAFCIPLLQASWLYLLFKKIEVSKQLDLVVGAVGSFVCGTVLFDVFDVYTFDFCYPGGLLGHFFFLGMVRAGIDLVTQKIIWIVLGTASANLLLRFSFLPALQLASYWLRKLFHKNSLLVKSIIAAGRVGVQVVMRATQLVQDAYRWYMQKIVEKYELAEPVESKKYELQVQDLVQEFIARPAQKVELDVVLEEPVRQLVHDQPTAYATQVPASKTPVYELPQDELFELAPEQVKHKQKKVQSLQEHARLLEEKLKLFGIAGHVTAIHPGPVVTLFEYKPEHHVKISRIVALEDDLAMALEALSIRIIAPIPGKSVVGFEVANPVKESVLFADIIHSDSYKKSTAYLPMILGQDTQGHNVVVDLVKMPHLLVAGSTGSGKSVALNAMLTTLLCSRTPQELKLILIDPKRLEFALYEDIAHLLFPIIKETQKAIPALKWVVKTMEDRYAIMAELGVKNIIEYHKRQKEGADVESMPFIVVVIDELADLMMTSGKAVEESIARIAQMARAAGIHLIVATQRPSVDVITGMIKVNLPNRISFKVTSKIDSRTILDASGAEKLLGRGDMLFLDASQSHLVRLHGAYVSDQEISKVVDHIKQQQKVAYLDMMQYVLQADGGDMLDGDEELYQEVVDFLDTIDEVSISMLQRQFRIGYNRSARMISLLESQGKVLSMDGGKMRRVVKE